MKISVRTAPYTEVVIKGKDFRITIPARPTDLLREAARLGEVRIEGEVADRVCELINDAEEAHPHHRLILQGQAANLALESILQCPAGKARSARADEIAAKYNLS